MFIQREMSRENEQKHTDLFRIQEENRDSEQKGRLRSDWGEEDGEDEGEMGEEGERGRRKGSPGARWQRNAATVMAATAGKKGAERGHRGTRRRNSATVMAVATAALRDSEPGSSAG